MQKNSPEKFERPWGHYENILEEQFYKVKRLVVNPNQQLSLQYHHHRTEHWTVVDGSGKVTIEDHVYDAGIRSSFRIGVRQTHRLSAGENGITIIEVQLGSNCSEDDIVRLKDDYQRV